MDHCTSFRFIIFAWSNALDTSLFFQARSIPMFFLCSTPNFLLLVSNVLYRFLGNMECNLRIAAKCLQKDLTHHDTFHFLDVPDDVFSNQKLYVLVAINSHKYFVVYQSWTSLSYLVFACNYLLLFQK